MTIQYTTGSEVCLMVLQLAANGNFQMLTKGREFAGKPGPPPRHV